MFYMFGVGKNSDPQMRNLLIYSVLGGSKGAILTRQ